MEFITARTNAECARSALRLSPAGPQRNAALHRRDAAMQPLGITAIDANHHRKWNRMQRFDTGCRAVRGAVDQAHAGRSAWDHAPALPVSAVRRHTDRPAFAPHVRGCSGHVARRPRSVSRLRQGRDKRLQRQSRLRPVRQARRDEDAPFLIGEHRCASAVTAERDLDCDRMAVSTLPMPTRSNAHLPTTSGDSRTMCCLAYTAPLRCVTRLTS